MPCMPGLEPTRQAAQATLLRWQGSSRRSAHKAQKTMTRPTQGREEVMVGVDSTRRLPQRFFSFLFLLLDVGYRIRVGPSDEWRLDSTAL